MAQLKYPQSVTWEVTPACNHACIHCYNSWRTQEQTKYDDYIHSQTTEQGLLTVAQKIVDAKPRKVTITGGEPLLLFNKLVPSIELLLNSGIRIGVNTNVVLLTDEMAKYFASRKIGLFVSFPCSEPEICDKIVAREGAFNRICEGLRTADRNGVSYSLNMVITKLNFDYMESTAKFLVDNFKPKGFCISKASMPCNADPEMINIALGPDEHIQSFRVLKQITDKYGLDTDSARARCLCMFTDPDMIKAYGFKRTCSAGKTVCTVGYNGDIRACESDTVAYGHILKDTIPEAMARMTDWQEDSKLPQECKECKHHESGICNGGCRFDAESTTGLANALDSAANINNAKTIDYSKYKPKMNIIIEPCVEYKLKAGVKTEVKDGQNRVYSDRAMCSIGNKTFEYITTHDTFTVMKATAAISYGAMGSILQQLNALLVRGLIEKA